MGCFRLPIPLLALAVLCGFGCSSSYSPRDAAAERLRFLRQHGSTLSTEQVRLIHQVPYRSRSADRSRMNSILRGEETQESVLDRRRRLLDRHGVKIISVGGDGGGGAVAGDSTTKTDSKTNDEKTNEKNQDEENKRKPESGEDEAL